MKEIRGGYMLPKEAKKWEATALFEDLLRRTQENGGIFFGVDTSSMYTKLENLQSNQARLTAAQKRYYREKWEWPFDIDYRLHYGRDAETPGGTVYHEVKAMERTLEADKEYSMQYGGMDEEGNYLFGPAEGLWQGCETFTTHTRGKIPVEIVGNYTLLAKYGAKLKRVNGAWICEPGREQTDTVPDTDIASCHTPGEPWPIKGSFKANFFHFYLPMMPHNEGRKRAEQDEVERMQAHTRPGDKLIIEAPAGLFITISQRVEQELWNVSLEHLAQEFDRVEQARTLQERREVLEEYFANPDEPPKLTKPSGETVEIKKVVNGINVLVPATKLVQAFERALGSARNGGFDQALLEVRPVVRFIRNGDSAQTEEIEAVENGREYWIPKGLQDVYFNGGALKREIQGYWDDRPERVQTATDGTAMPGRRLLGQAFGFESRIRQFHVVAPEPAQEWKQGEE